MKAVFADTGHWIAVLNPDDALHDRALQVANALGEVRIVTSQLILMEVLGFFSAYGHEFRRRAAQMIRILEADPRVEVEDQTPVLFERSLSLYENRPDKDWSLVDCSSFVIMESRGIREALAYDYHFSQAGFAPLLREP